MYSVNVSWFFTMSVSTFGNLRIYRLFAAPRSLSQLVTSFFGSWCQGIHLMLLFAWTSFWISSAVLLNCLSFIKQFLFFRISFAVKRFYPFHFRKLFFIPPFGEIVVYPNFLERPILISLKICPLLSVRFYSSLHLLFGFQWTLSSSDLSSKAFY